MLNESTVSRRAVTDFGFVSSVAVVWVAFCLPAVGAPTAPVPADFRLEYSRGPCEGTCPEYSVKVDAAGRVSWLGKSSVYRKVPASKTISAAAVGEIATAVSSLHLEGTRAEIRCIDTPVFFIAVTTRQTTASIKVDDCPIMLSPAARHVIEVGKLLDHIVGVQSWVITP
jgi:Domain of unknown function (DUF6438)